MQWLEDVQLTPGAPLVLVADARDAIDALSTIALDDEAKKQTPLRRAARALGAMAWWKLGAVERVGKLTLSHTPAGQPQVPGGWSLSLTHVEPRDEFGPVLAACIARQGVIGIDLERRRNLKFAHDWQALIAHLGAGDAATGWTHIEALSKAMGTGVGPVLELLREAVRPSDLAKAARHFESLLEKYAITITTVTTDPHFVMSIAHAQVSRPPDCARIALSDVERWQADPTYEH